MPFPDSFLQELKLRSDITEIASSYVNLKRHGRNMVGLCPFHGEKTPSFNIYTENGSFYFLSKKMSYTCIVISIQSKSNIYDCII